MKNYAAKLTKKNTKKTNFFVIFAKTRKFLSKPSSNIAIWIQSSRKKSRNKSDGLLFGKYHFPQQKTQETRQARDRRSLAAKKQLKQSWSLTKFQPAKKQKQIHEVSQLRKSK